MTVSVATIGEQALRRLGVAVVSVADRPPAGAIVAAATMATNALVELGVIASDETPSATDQSLVLAKLAAVHDSLSANANVRWTVNAVPLAVSEEYTRLTALQAASAFGKQVDPAMLAMLEGRVRKVAMIMQAPDDATAAVMSVHQDLTARGLARWSVFDIPDAVTDPYTVMAADALAPLFGMDTDAKDTQDAIIAIYRYIALPTSGERTVAEYF
jgi:hypothetical protein